MISSLLIFLDITVSQAQTFFRKPYTLRFGQKGVYLFNAFAALSAIAFFILSAGRLQWEAGILPYAIGFGVSYAVSTAFSLLAISCGPISLTSLIMASSTFISTLYGLLFLKEEVRLATFLPGMVLLMASLILANKPQKGEMISVKWLLFAVLAAVGNVGCTIFQTAQQVAFNEQYGNELMILALLFVLVVFSLLSLLPAERKEFKAHIKHAWYGGLACGALNGANNLLVMIVRPMVGAAVLFPVLTGGGLIGSYLISTLAYKEKLTAPQTFGFILGIAAVVLIKL